MGGEPLTVQWRETEVMASEPSDESLSVSLPADLGEWVDRQATALGVDRETVVVQLLASYRAVEELEGDVDANATLASETNLEDRVRDVVAERIPDIAAAVSEQLDDGGDAAEVEERLTADLDRLESEFIGKIEDVRERVIQVKREADAKAPAEHGHEELDALAATVADLEASLDDLESTVDDHGRRLDETETDLDAVDDRLDDLASTADRLDEVEDRLRTVAWVVSDLRDAQEAQTAGTEAIDRLKRTAARIDVDRAVCENCSEPVEIALLSRPVCPHCDAAFGDVEPAGGFFGKPKLTTARQLEASDEAETRGNVPDAADQRGPR